MANKKRGRPLSDNPRNVRISVRFTKEEFEKLDAYCKEKGMSAPQVLRDAVKAILQK